MAQIVAGEVYPGITVDPAIVHGKPVITGTRIMASQIVGHLAAGDTIETVCEAYDLTPEQVRAVMDYERSVMDQLATQLGGERPWLSEMVIEDRGPR